MTSRRWSNVTKIIVTSALAVLAIVLLITFRTMIAPTIVAFLLAFILGYPVNWIQRRTGWSRGITVTVLYVVLLAGIILTPVIFVPQIDDVGAAWSSTLEELIRSLQTTATQPIAIVGYELSVESLLLQTGNALQNILVLSTSNPLSIFRGVTTGVLTVVYVLVLNFWLLKDLHKLQRLIMEQVPGGYQEEVHRLGHELGQIWHAFLRGQLALALVVGFATWVALTIVGMPNASGLAILAGFMEFLPTIGPGISGFIGTMLALFQGSNWSVFQNNFIFALIVLLIYVVITQVESVYLIPKLVGGRVRLHPAVTFVGVISGALVFGVLGVLLATPTIASTRQILVYIYRKLFDMEPFEAAGASQPVVRIRGLIAGRKIEGVIFDLDGTLTALDWSAADGLADQTQWLERVMTREQRKYIARRVMVKLDGFLIFVVQQMRRLQLYTDIQRLEPVLDRLRGHPPPGDLELLPGVSETLQILHRSYRLSLVSTRNRQVVCDFLARVGLANNTFEAIVVNEDVRNIMPQTEALLAAAERMQMDVGNIVVVADSDIKLRSGSAVQMATAGVLGGLSQEKDMPSADLILGNMPEIIEWL